MLTIDAKLGSELRETEGSHAAKPSVLQKGERKNSSSFYRYAGLVLGTRDMAKHTEISELTYWLRRQTINMVFFFVLFLFFSRLARATYGSSQARN